MCEEVPTIRAIKDWSNNVPQHEWHVRTLQSLARPVTVLSTHSAWLMSSLVLGCKGLLSGNVQCDLRSAGAAVPRRAGPTTSPRRSASTIASIRLARVFYADPAVDMHNRMKEALVLLGKLPRAVVRPPLTKIESRRVERIRLALVEAGLLDAKRGATPREA